MLEVEVSAGAVVARRGRDGSEVLLIKDRYGNWGFPKGHVEPNEGPADAALRECQEETGLRPERVLGFLGMIDWYFRFGGRGIHKYCDYYLVEAPSDARAKPQAAEGVQACDWRSPESALRKLTYENARRVLRLAIRRLESDAAAGSAGATGAGGG